MILFYFLSKEIPFFLFVFLVFLSFSLFFPTWAASRLLPAGPTLSPLLLYFLLSCQTSLLSLFPSPLAHFRRNPLPLSFPLLPPLLGGPRPSAPSPTSIRAWLRVGSPGPTSRMLRLAWTLHSHAPLFSPMCTSPNPSRIAHFPRSRTARASSAPPPSFEITMPPLIRRCRH